MTRSEFLRALALLGLPCGGCSDAPRFILNSIAFGNGRFVAVGSHPVVGEKTPFILTSTDGVTWTQPEIESVGELKSVVVGNGRFVAVGGSPSYSSEDGVTFESSVQEKDLSSVTWAADRFWAVAPDGVVYVSDDGRAWSRASSTSMESASHIAFASGRFVVADAFTDQFATSEDAIEWTTDDIGWDLQFAWLIADGDGFVAGVRTNVGPDGDVGGHALIRSDDGSRWSSPEPLPTPDSGGIATADGRTILATGSGLFVWSDGAWVLDEPTADGPFRAIATGDGMVVAVGYDCMAVWDPVENAFRFVDPFAR